MRTLHVRQIRILCDVIPYAELRAALIEAKQLAAAAHGVAEFKFNGILLRVHGAADLEKVAAYFRATLEATDTYRKNAGLWRRLGLDRFFKGRS